MGVTGRRDKEEGEGIRLPIIRSLLSTYCVLHYTVPTFFLIFNFFLFFYAPIILEGTWHMVDLAHGSVFFPSSQRQQKNILDP